MRLRSAGGEDEVLDVPQLERRLGFKYVATIEWSSAALHRAYQAWGIKQQKEIEQASLMDPSEAGKILQEVLFLL